MRLRISPKLAMTFAISLAGVCLLASAATASEGRILVPYVTGRPETHVFAGHPGWVDAYHAGHGEGISARIGEDGTFKLPEPLKQKPLTLILYFDEMETPATRTTRRSRSTGSAGPGPSIPSAGPLP